MVTCKERLKNFDWKKNWKWIAAGVAILVLVIAALILIVILMRGPKCESAPPLPYNPYTPPAPANSNSTGADSGGSFEKYQIDGLNKHNEYRAKHRVPAMTLDENLNSKAVQCAQHYVGINKIDHSCPFTDGAGENLYMRGGTDLTDSENSIQATQLWYDEIKDYKYHSPGFGKDTGHFTQLVWKTSTKLGVGFGKGKIAVIVALYQGPGNFQGKFPENVPKPSC